LFCLCLQARSQIKNNLRYKAADIVRTQAKLAYQRAIDRTAHTATHVTKASLLTGKSYYACEHAHVPGVCVS